MNEQPTDLILHNGKIATQDDRRSVVEALAIRDGKFLAVGSDREVMPFRDQGTKLIDAIQQTLRAELGTSPDELFHIIHLPQPGQFRHTRSFLGLNYSDDLIWLELTLITGRVAKEKRLGLLKALSDGVVDAAQISPDDLLITFFETARENISFGRGFAQRADNSKPYSKS